MKTIEEMIMEENKRQDDYVELIASENFVSQRVLNAAGSKLTNKYAEGYPGKRYYNGCDIVDQIEQRAIDNAKKIFKANYANVQPHSGSQANMAAYLSVLKPGDKILGMSLSSGGHLTHGHVVSSTGIIFEATHYYVDEKTNELDYEAIEAIAIKEKPQLIVCGASAYSRMIDFEKFQKIAKKVGAYLLADIAHIAGLIVAGLHQSPLEYCDIVTTTTHKTLRGPRGGMILTNDEEIAKKIDKSVFPGNQGGPLVHIIAAKAIAFEEASTISFSKYQKQIIKNAKAMSEYFLEKNVSIISGGTDNHLFLIDVKKSFGLTGNIADALLFKANIITNKNSIPFDTERPMVTSGIRIGTPAMTTKGFKEKEFIEIAKIIFDVLTDKTEEFAISQQSKVIKILRGINNDNQ